MNRMKSYPTILYFHVLHGNFLWLDICLRLKKLYIILKMNREACPSLFEERFDPIVLLLQSTVSNASELMYLIFNPSFEILALQADDVLHKL